MAVIGIDIDGTLAEKGPWVKGDHIPHPDARMAALVAELASRGHRLFAWSCRADYVVTKWLTHHNLIHYFEGVNYSPYPTESGKASFDFYIGDEAIRWHCFNDKDILYRITRESLVQKGPADFDRDHFFSSHNPRPYLAGVGVAYVDQFEEHWKAAWTRHQQSGKTIGFLTICSHAKPYSKSFIHTSIRAALFREGYLGACDYIHISNAGIIPASAEMEYPFNAYDWNGDLCTPEVKQYHIAAIKRRFTEWLLWKGGNYDRIVVYLREGGNTIGAVRAALQEFESGASHRPWSTKVTVVAASADEEHYPQFVQTHDPDDCLTSAGNLHHLTVAIRGHK
jgi:hypothetical protein